MKMLKWLSKLMIGTVLISSISIFTTWYIVNLYVEEVFRQLQIPALGKKVSLSDFASKLAGDLNLGKPKDGGSVSVPQPGPSPSAGGAATPGTGQPDAAASGKGAQGGSSAKDDSVAVMGRGQSESDSLKKDLVLSTEEFAKKKEQMSGEDKMKLFSLVIAKLPQPEVQRLSGMLEEGITAEEMKEIDRMLKTYLNDDEYKQLMAIINKY